MTGYEALGDLLSHADDVLGLVVTDAAIEALRQLHADMRPAKPSVRHRLEIFMGGPARLFPLTAADADTLVVAMDNRIAEFQEEAIRDGGDPVDPQIIEGFRLLRARLRAHAGFHASPLDPSKKEDV